MSTDITWLGHATVKIESNDTIIYFDPWIKGNPKCPVSLESITEVDAVCVTHGHDDHIGNTLEIIRQTGAKLLCSPEIGIYFDKKGISYDEDSYPLNIGGSWQTDSCTITMVHAVHTSDILGEEFAADGTVIPGSGSAGYVVEFTDGPCVYYSGDTGVFSDMAIIRDLYKPDVALLSVGGKYNMGVREAAYAAGLLLPEIVIPFHHGTFPNQEVDMGRLASEMAVRAPKASLITIVPGETFTFGE